MVNAQSSSPKTSPSSPDVSPDEDADKTAGDADKPGLGRAYVPWNAEEEECLRLGVVRHGVGAWQIILRDPDFSLLKYDTVQCIALSLAASCWYEGKVDVIIEGAASAFRRAAGL
eukprot:scaffold318526_cov49-Prasinocladus_malaysianus.AAC.1